MGTISRTGITGGGTIEPTHIINIIDALDGTSTTTTVVATGSFNGTLVGSASYATTALSASYASNVPTTASYALTALSASYATTASYALNSGGTGIFVQTGSIYATTNTLQVTGSLIVTGGVTASLLGTASFADTSDQLLVQRTVTEASFYPVIADSANATATAERLKTTTTMTINPGTNVIAGATLSGSICVSGSMTALDKHTTVDLSAIADPNGNGQFIIPKVQTSGTPLAGSMYWNDTTTTLYIYSATNAAWYSIALNP